MYIQCSNGLYRAQLELRHTLTFILLIFDKEDAVFHLPKSSVLWNVGRKY